MSSALLAMSASDLRAMCAERQLARYGDKSMLIARLQSGATGKKKPGPQVGTLRKTIAKTSAQTSFYEKERSRLIAQGILDKKAQDAELDRRWNAKKSSPSKGAATASKPGQNNITFTFALSSSMQKQRGLRFVGEEMDGQGKKKYIYEKLGGASKAVTFVADDMDDVSDENDSAGEEDGDGCAILTEEQHNEIFDHQVDRLMQNHAVTKAMLLPLVMALDPSAKVKAAGKEELCGRLIEQLMDEEDDESGDEE